MKQRNRRVNISQIVGQDCAAWGLYRGGVLWRAAAVLFGAPTA